MLRNMHIPEINTLEDDGVNGSFVIEPLHRGFGVTLGNALRRVLMSSLDGAAITAFKVEGASHEFSTHLEGETGLNTFLGDDAGSNTTGSQNSFFGRSAGHFKFFHGA